MATDLERLVVQLSADIKGYENALKRAQGVTTSQTRRIQGQFNQMNKGLTAGFGKLGVALGAAFAAQGAVRNAQRLIDTSLRIENALKVAGLSGAELEGVYQKLFASAQKNAAPIETLVTLYGRAAIVQKELGVSSAELLNFTDKVALALRVAGTDAQTASGALLQLSQALGSGVVRAEEFNSVLEGALPIAQAAAAGLEEAGGSVAKLRQLVVDGKVSSEAFFRAFEAGAPILEQKVANATLTLDQRLVNLQNSLVDAARRFNTSTEAAETFGTAIDNVASFVNSINFDALISQIGGVASAFNSATGAISATAQELGALSGLENVGKLLTGGAVQKSFLGGALTVTSSGALQERINKAFEGEIQKAGALTEEAIKASVLGQGGGVTQKTGRLPASNVNINPVSLSDFAPPSGKSKGGGGAGGKSKQSDFQRETEQIRERTAALIAETEAQAGINPLVNDYGFTLAKVRAEQELLHAAQEDGKQITPQLRAEIEQLATAYADAEVAAEKLTEQQEGAVEVAGFFADTLGQAFMDLIPAIETGNKALDNLLNTLIEAVVQAALLGKGPLASLFGGGGGGGLGGILGGIFGKVLHKGGVVGQGGESRMVSPSVFAGALRMHSGGVAGLKSGEVPAILQKGEIVIPRGATRQEQQPLNIVSRFDADGGFESAVERTSRPIARMESVSAAGKVAKSVPAMVDNRNDERQFRRLRPSFGGS